MKHTPVAALLAALAAPALAAAPLSFGLRASYAIPGGDAYEHSGIGAISESGLSSRLVPIQLDAAWRFNPRLSAGVYWAYGFGQTGSDLKGLCATPGSSCTTPIVVRFGARGAWAFSSQGKADPWVGLTAGVESASFKVGQYQSVADLRATLRGWETAMEGGVDHQFTPTFVAGPVLSLNFGQYTVQHVTFDGHVAGGGVEQPKLHRWVSLGVRGRFDL